MDLSKQQAKILTVIIAIIFILIMVNPVVMVDVGKRGIKTTWGKVSPRSYSEGIHFVIPVAQRMTVMNVRTQKSKIDTQLYTKDIQQAKISYVVAYNLNPADAYKVYRDVGKDYFDKIILPTVQGTLKNVVGGWNASDLIANRQTATSKVLERLKENLSDNYISVTDFQIINIDYSDTFENSIEAKVVAQQNALKAKNITVQIQEEAKQKLISAEAEAKSMSIRANALMRNKALVEYEAVQKWDGKLPNYMMGSSVPFINLK